jgi:hypothetical protein
MIAGVAPERFLAWKPLMRPVPDRSRDFLGSLGLSGGEQGDPKKKKPDWLVRFRERRVRCGYITRGALALEVAGVVAPLHLPRQQKSFRESEDADILANACGLPGCQIQPKDLQMYVNY